MLNLGEIMQLKVRINPIMLSNIESFKSVKGYSKNCQKDVYFIGYCGVISKEKYKEEMSKLIFSKESYWIKNFVKNLDYDEIEKYNKFYTDIESKKDLKIIYDFKDEVLNDTFFSNYQKILTLYIEEKKCNETMKKNYAIKIIAWIIKYFSQIFSNGDTTKIIYSGKLGLQEYLFLYFIALLGKDVIYLNPQKKAFEISERLLKLSHIIVEKESLEENIEEIIKVETKNVETPKDEPIRIKIESRRENTRYRVASQTVVAEKEYEDLARLAENVVMISVYDSNNTCIKTGSGVIFTKGGYILTNFHVVSGGAYYEIILENRVERSYTSTIIKYSDFYDLAIIRIEPSDKYIPVLKPQNDKRLVRGQKVVAIGSPLGLFNSVSDGIISGFRVIRDVEMVQFTAPISPGSSGGALLNRYGQLIGLITAGFSEGQNINLAVSYEIVYDFIKNFLQGDE